MQMTASIKQFMPWVKRILRKPANNTTLTLGLRPLYAEKQAGQEVYVAELNAAVNNPKIYNVALTGNYGSGKSSILADFSQRQPFTWRWWRRRRRIVQISLATLDADAHAATPDESARGKSEPTGAETAKSQAVAIQKEIVKQLFFKMPPHIMTNSKFKRISAPYLPRLLLYAGLCTTVLVPVIYCLCSMWLHFAPAAVWPPSEKTLGGLAGLIMVIFALSALLLLVAYGKFGVSKVAGGPVALTLTDKNNYFDQYLDELIYFFQIAKTTVVILEDIERFDNAYIFMTLKQLNSLLHEAEQIKQRVCFVYAIKDSLFSLDTLELYEQSANRAKFFDLIIPVVPLVTHVSSRDVINDTLNHKRRLTIGKEVIAAVSPYVTDMRLIKNIHNEYLVFAKMILGDDKLAGLTSDKLFAMVVYKNVYLKDFENIKRGVSKLDDVYKAQRQNIEHNAARLQSEIATGTTQLESPGTIASLSDQYGQKLGVYLTVTVSGLQTATNVTYNLLNASYTLEQMKTTAFWEAVNHMGANDRLVITYQRSYQTYTPIQLDRAMIETISGDLNFTRLEDDDKAALQEKIQQWRQELRELPYRSIGQNLDATNASGQTLRDQIREIIGTESAADLAYSLLVSGYIDSYFTLYTSLFKGTNPKAANFLLHHLQLNKPDIYYKFGRDQQTSDTNVKVLLTEYADSYAKSKALYNVDVLNYLLRTAIAKPRSLSNSHTLNHILNNLVKGQREDENFLNAYLTTGDEPAKLIQTISGRWAGVFDYLILNQSLSHDRKIKFFDAALSGASRNTDYHTEEDISDFLAQNATRLETFTKPLKAATATDLRIVLPQLDMKLPSFNGLTDTIRDIAISHDMYQINRRNVEVAVHRRNLSLDNIMTSNDQVFAYVANHIEAYVAIVDGSKTTRYTIDTNDHFAAILNHVAVSDPDNLTNIINRAASDCIVANINDAPIAAWPALLDKNAVAPLLSNILAYYRRQEATPFDEHLAAFLRDAPPVTIDIDITENTETLQSLAIAILSREDITLAAKTALVVNIHLPDPIPVGAFPSQHGDLYGRLVAAGIITDNAASYAALQGTGLATQLPYIVQSPQFATYMHELTLSSEELAALATSMEVSPAIKHYLVQHLTNFTPELPAAAIASLATFAVEQNLALDVTTLFAMLGKTDTPTAVQLINLSKESFTRDGMASILAMIGGVYGKLAQPKAQVLLDITPYNQQLVEQLTSLGTISSSKLKETKNGLKLKVNMKKRW
jgi:hypothetical protein